MSEEVSRCHSCLAPIIWVELLKKDGSSGKHPLDATPLGMRIVRFGRDGQSAKFAQTYQSHYATCPDAKGWRGKKET